MPSSVRLAMFQRQANRRGVTRFLGSTGGREGGYLARFRAFVVLHAISLVDRTAFGGSRRLHREVSGIGRKLLALLRSWRVLQSPRVAPAAVVTTTGERIPG